MVENKIECSCINPITLALGTIKTGNTDTEKIWQFPEKFVDSSIKPELPEKIKLTFLGSKETDQTFYNVFNQLKKWNETKKNE